MSLAHTYAQIGNGGALTSGNHSGDITVTSAQGDIRFTGGNMSNSYAQVGNGGALTGGNHSGNIFVTAEIGDVVLTAGSVPLAYAQIGHGDWLPVANGTRAGDITVLTGDDLLLTGAQIGHTTSDGVNAITNANWPYLPIWGSASKWRQAARCCLVNP